MIKSNEEKFGCSGGINFLLLQIDSKLKSDKAPTTAIWVIVIAS